MNPDAVVALEPHIVNPDAVVALAAATFGNTSSTDAREPRSSTSEPTNGLHPDLNRRTAPILDALAAICVKGGQHDVAAVALKLELPRVELFLATNDETPEQDTIKHIQDVWRILKDLSHSRFRGTDGNEKVDLRKASPPHRFTDREQRSLVNDLHRLVYKHSYLKLCRRQEKYMKVILKLKSSLEPGGKKSTNKEEDPMAEDNDPTKEEFLRESMLELIGFLDLYSTWLGEYHDDDWAVNDDKISKFTVVLETIRNLAKIILGGGDACERWMDKLNCESEP